ncbi:MAG: polyphosphate polymerase domain-containing protein [Erysipelotrichaceae bacterium]|nr:polyphosphate polymerase domain-containing protein [Erysipelotrichaceae bacterium]
MERTIFKRYENKYLISQEQYDFILPLLLEHTKLDDYCADNQSYFINNIYFDTQYNSIIRQSLAKPEYKEKLRLRGYQLFSQPEDAVFLELKKKYQGVVYKRRVGMSYQEALNLVEKNIKPIREDYQDQQIIEEIAYFVHTNEIKKHLYMNYQRIALSGINQPDLRITFDKDIYYHYEKDVSKNLLSDNTYLLEIKTSTSLPIWLVNTLSALQIYQISFSKYGKIYAQSLPAYSYDLTFNINGSFKSAMKGSWQYV